MSDVAKVRGLYRRGSVWYYRKRVPLDLIDAFGCKELKRALGPVRYDEAKRKRNALAVEFDAGFKRRRAGLLLAGREVGYVSVGAVGGRHREPGTFFAKIVDAVAVQIRRLEMIGDPIPVDHTRLLIRA